MIEFNLRDIFTDSDSTGSGFSAVCCGHCDSGLARCHSGDFAVCVNGCHGCVTAAPGNGFIRRVLRCDRCGQHFGIAGFHVQRRLIQGDARDLVIQNIADARA